MRDAIYSVDEQGFPRLGFQSYGRENLISCASAMEPFLSFQSGIPWFILKVKTIRLVFQGQKVTNRITHN